MLLLDTTRRIILRYRTASIIEARRPSVFLSHKLHEYIRSTYPTAVTSRSECSRSSRWISPHTVSMGTLVQTSRSRSLLLPIVKCLVSSNIFFIIANLRNSKSRKTCSTRIGLSKQHGCSMTDLISTLRYSGLVQLRPGSTKPSSKQSIAGIAISFVWARYPVIIATAIVR